MWSANEGEGALWLLKGIPPQALGRIQPLPSARPLTLTQLCPMLCVQIGSSALRASPSAAYAYSCSQASGFFLCLCLRICPACVVTAPFSCLSCSYTDGGLQAPVLDRQGIGGCRTGRKQRRLSLSLSLSKARRKGRTSICRNRPLQPFALTCRGSCLELHL